MRIKNSFFYTLREDSSDDASTSGSLLTRAGMIKKAGSGLYVFMPMGLRVLRKVEGIIKEEMDRAGAQELVMPSMLPIDVYEQCGRVEAFGDGMFKFKDRNLRDYCLGPTHEEMFALAAKEMVRSYKDLPFNLYQQADKFRDEPRPRYGLIRTREFIMKDAYTFDTPETQPESYKKMYDAYCRIFDRMKIDYKIVRADVGAMGGDLSEEYQALTDIGEDTIVLCDGCDYAENLEVATTKMVGDKDKPKKLEKVKTPHCKTIEDVCNFLNVPVEKSVKALLMNVDEEFVCFFVRGDREFNVSKACKLLGVSEINFANDELIATSNACPGFTGPVGLNCKVVIDEEVKLMHNFVVGANEEDYHFINCNIDDIKYDVSGDISNVTEGDICPDCGGKLYFKKGIEIGNLFKLGTKYSEALGLTYLDKDNKANPVVMGSYGIGPARVISSVVEQNNDGHGIIFPVSIAPYSVCIVVTNVKDEDALNYAYSLEKELEEAGIDVLVDDRDERAGVKFNDMDLLGIPFRVTVGRAFKDGEVEFKLRRDSDSTNISTDKIVKTIKKAIEKDL